MSRHEEPPLTPEFILRLQKTVGNRAVQRVIAARSAAASRAASQAVARTVTPAAPILLPPAPTTNEESPELREVEVITVVPADEPRHWNFIIARLIIRVVGWTGSRLRLKGKTDDA